MCLPSSLLKAGSQLHGSRDSEEAEGPSLVRSEAEPSRPLAGVAKGGERRGLQRVLSAPLSLRRSL